MRALKIIVAVLLGTVLLLVVAIVVLMGPRSVAGLFGLDVLATYDETPPVLPRLSERAILVFSKTNGFRDDAQIKAANPALERIAKELGGDAFVTENGAVFNTAQLSAFKAVVWNSVSGDVLTAEQREAFKQYLEHGGGFVGFHGAGGDPAYKWKWYVDELIGAQFIGHTMGPQFQTATLRIEDARHPAMHGLGATWSRSDEWYSFDSSPRKKGYRILATLDEQTYTPRMDIFGIIDKDIRMGDHPIIWAHCVGDGRAFYSALGHRVDSYSEAAHLQMIKGAVAWAAGLDGYTCHDGVEIDAADAQAKPVE